jgi:hypothetical protein
LSVKEPVGPGARWSVPDHHRNDRLARPTTFCGNPPPPNAVHSIVTSFVRGQREPTDDQQVLAGGEPRGRSCAAPVAGSTAYPRPLPGSFPDAFGSTGLGRASSSRRSRLASRPTYTKKEPKPTRRSGVTSTPHATSTIPNATEIARRLAPKPMHSHPPIEKTRSRSMPHLWICSRDHGTRKVPRPSVDPAIPSKGEGKVARKVGEGARRSFGSGHAPDPAGRLPRSGATTRAQGAGSPIARSSWSARYSGLSP